MKRVLILCLHRLEEQYIARQPFVKGRYELIFHGGSIGAALGTFDALAFIDATVKQFQSMSLDGVASSGDCPGCLVAAAVAQRLGLPGPDPAKLLLCSHKYYSRLVQLACVPEATAGFALIDPTTPQPPPGLTFPLFVKPVKSWFSVFARRMDSENELLKFVSCSKVRNFLEESTRPFNQLLKHYGQFDLDARYMLAEELISGNQVTIEGFIDHGNVEIMGIVDSIMHPGRISFARFDYPSSLHQMVQKRMIDIVRRIIQGIGLDNSLFNVELFYDAIHDDVKIIEINPRMAIQFADLMEKVNGINTFDIMLSLATGQTPSTRVDVPKYSFAASFPLRVFQDKRIVRLPDREQILAVYRAFPDIRLIFFHGEGEKLSDAAADDNDVESYCYGYMNMGGTDRVSLLEDFARAYEMLGIVLEDID